MAMYPYNLQFNRYQRPNFGGNPIQPPSLTQAFLPQANRPTSFNGDRGYQPAIPSQELPIQSDTQPQRPGPAVSPVSAQSGPMGYNDFSSQFINKRNPDFSAMTTQQIAQQSGLSPQQVADYVTQAQGQNAIGLGYQTQQPARQMMNQTDNTVMEDPNAAGNYLAAYNKAIAAGQDPTEFTNQYYGVKPGLSAIAEPSMSSRSSYSPNSSSIGPGAPVPIQNPIQRRYPTLSAAYRR
jgi:hypothetical protein